MDLNQEAPPSKPSVSLVFAFAVVAAVFLFYLHFVWTYGANVPFWDDWELLDLIRNVQTGQMHWWRLLLERHNEHLIGVPFLFESWQLLVTGFNYKLQLVTGAVLQAISFSIAVSALWTSIPKGRRALWLAVSALIWFSVCQHKNLLWAFQTAWFLITLFLVVALVSLRRAVDKFSGIWFSLAVAVAVLSSFSLMQGLIVWPAGLVYLWGCESFKLRQSAKSSLVRNWVISGVVTGIPVGFLWFRGSRDFPVGPEKFSLRTVAHIFFGIHGDFWGNLGERKLIVLGIGMLVFVCLGLTRIWFSKDRAAYAMPAAFIAFGLSFVLLVSVGRAQFGIGPASDSHYTAYSVLAFFGVLTIFVRRDETLPTILASRWLPWTFSAVTVCAAFSASYDAVLNGINWRTDHEISEAALLQYERNPDFMLQRMLFGDAAMVRRNGAFLNAQGFGPFDSPNVSLSVAKFVTLPHSMEQAIDRYPENREAILRAWQVYQIGPDLRAGFNPASDQFAQDFLTWCGGTTQKKNSHYLSEYLDPFAADYDHLRTALLADKMAHQ